MSPRHLARKGLATIPIVLDPDSTAINAYGVSELPITFVIDPAGIVQAKVIGELTPTLLKSYLNEADF